MESQLVLWYLFIGLLLVATATLDVVFRRLPISTAMIYLALGVAVGPFGLGMLVVHPLRHAELLERLAEIAVIISLFAAGLKMRLPLRDRRWAGPILLASVGMVLTVAAIAAAGYWGMGLTLGGAVLLGAMLAPTDPVLASAVQVSKPDDRDRLRRTLTGEAGLNDGTAFPFVMLGLGLYAGGLHSLGAGGWRWVAIDLLWAVTGGLGVGWLSGLWVGRAVLYLRRRFRESITADEMLTIGMIALVYGLALAIHTYAFLAVFAAAVAIRREEHLQNMGRSAEEAHREAAVMLPDGKPEADEAADVPQDLRRLAPAQMAQAQLQMTESLERLIEVTLVLLVGALISFRTFSHPAVWWFIPLLLIGIRPAVVMISTIRVRMVPAQRLLAGWFGIRGVGTIYYLAFALTHGVEKENPTEARVLVDFAVATVCVSVVLHGISATPLMDWYTRTRRGPSEPAAARLPGRSGAVE